MSVGCQNSYSERNAYMIQKIVSLYFKFSKKMSGDRVRAHSAEAAFFLIMSFFPLLMLLLTLLQYTPITQEQVLYTLEQITPFSISDMLESLVAGLYRGSASMLVTWTTIVALWTAGKSVIGLTDGLNSVYRIESERNYIHLRVRAMFYALLMTLAILMSLVILVFGYHIIDLLKRLIPILRDYSSALSIFPTLIAMVILTLLFTMFYAYLPDKKQKFFRQIPGAVFASVAWTVFSYGFSLYLSYFPDTSVLYGSLATLVVVMLWLYFCMYLLFIGAEINYFLAQSEGSE